MASSTKLITIAILVSILVHQAALVSSTSCNPKAPAKKPSPAPKKPAPAPKKSAPATPAPATAKCPVDVLKLGACVDLLGGLVNVVLGSPPSGSKCCALIEGLADLEAALCLCTAIKANVLGLNIDIPVALSTIISSCQKTVPAEFTCP